MKNNTSLFYKFFLVIADLTALVAGFLAAFAIRAASPVGVAHPMEVTTYLAVLLGLLPFWILLFAMLGLYRTSIHERRFAEIGRLFVGSFTGLLFVVFWDYMSLETLFPAKLVPIYGFLIAFALLVIIRTLIRTIRSGLFRLGIGLSHLVVVGNSPITTELLRSLSSRSSGYKILGVVGYRKHVPKHVPAFKDFASFAATKPQDVHGIIQTEIYADETRNSEILDFAQENHVSYQFVPGNSELYMGNIDVDLFRNSIPVINVHQTALFGWGRLVKRLTDIVLGSTVLILSLPLWLVAIVLIKTSDPKGPLFYKANRYSRFGTKVGILKFRSIKQAYNNMSPEAGFKKMGRPDLIQSYRENGDQLADDPRYGAVGRFLRATSLDELPQMWNIVRGDISFVGPRALDTFEIDNYAKKHLLLSVKSGLTGLAIVSGRHALDFNERRKLDLYYVQNWSFWLDVVILLKTVRVVLGRIFRRGKRYE